MYPISNSIAKSKKEPNPPSKVILFTDTHQGKKYKVSKSKIKNKIDTN